jgi:hypothetical protein
MRMKAKDSWKNIKKRWKKEFGKEMKDMYKCEPFAINKIMKATEKNVE